MARGAKGNIGVYSMRERSAGLNEASVATVDLSCGLLLAVADARGPDSDSALRAGHMALQLLRLAVRGQRVHRENEAGIRAMLRAALGTTNNQLYELTHSEPVLNNTSCSVAVALVAGKGAQIAHVGDCRVCLVREGRILHMTEDHTTGGEWVAHGVMTEQQVKRNPEAWKITRTLGAKTRVQPTVRGLVLPLEKGDVLVLCNSQVHRHIEDAEMAGMAAQFAPQEFCEHLCRKAADRGGSADCRAVVYRSGGRGGRGSLLATLIPATSRARWIAAGVLMLAALAGALVLGPSYFGGQSKTESLPATRSQLATQHPAKVQSRPDPSDVSDVRTVPEVQLQPEVKQQEQDAPSVPEMVVRADVGQSPDVLAAPDVPFRAEVQAVPDVQARPDLRAEPETASRPEVHLQPEVQDAAPEAADKGYRPHGPARDCNSVGLTGTGAQATEKAGRILEKAFDKISGKRRSTSKAVEGYYDAVNVLNNGPPIAWKRCGWPVKELRNRIKNRYLRMANSAALKAAQNPDKRNKFCRSGKKRARDAVKFGATETEAAKSLGRCAKDRDNRHAR